MNCNDTLAAYSTTIEVPYGSTQPRAKCEQPSEDEESDALEAAKDKFKGIAAKYCAKKTCQQTTDHHQQTCAATVTITSVENLGVHQTDAPGNQKHCTLKFKITGKIECNCEPVRQG